MAIACYYAETWPPTMFKLELSITLYCVACRVTCRDWFQLSLKEGLTVFRDQVWQMFSLFLLGAMGFFF